MKKLLIATACALALSTTFAAAQMSQPQGSGMTGPTGNPNMANSQSMNKMGMRRGDMMMKKKMMMKRKMMSKRMMRNKRMRSM